MDPNATLQRIEDDLGDHDYTSVREACRDLSSWLARGGFEPQWEAYPAATKRFRRFQRTGR